LVDWNVVPGSTKLHMVKSASPCLNTYDIFVCAVYVSLNVPTRWRCCLPSLSGCWEKFSWKGCKTASSSWQKNYGNPPTTKSPKENGFSYYISWVLNYLSQKCRDISHMTYRPLHHVT